MSVLDATNNMNQNRIKIIIGLSIVFLILLVLVFIVLTRKSASPAPGNSTISETPLVRPTGISTGGTGTSGSGEVVYPIPEPTEAALAQASAEANFSKEIIDRDLRYPWLDRFPMSTDTYFMYYDIELETLVIKLYSPDTPELREQVTDKLKEQSIPYTELKVDWQNETN